jgi:hypothetical protein
VQSESIDRDADSDGLEEAAWSHSLRRAIRSRRDLLERLQLSWMADQLAEGAQQQIRSFSRSWLKVRNSIQPLALGLTRLANWRYRRKG